MQPGYRIVQYVNADGKVPFTSWLARLFDSMAKAKILIRIKRAQLGNLGQHRSVGAGVMELIVDTGPGYRVYFASVGQRDHALLAGGTKGSQRRDIVLAQKRWNDFKVRNDSTEFEG